MMFFLFIICINKNNSLFVSYIFYLFFVSFRFALFCSVQCCTVLFCCVNYESYVLYDKVEFSSIIYTITLYNSSLPGILPYFLLSSFQFSLLSPAFLILLFFLSVPFHLLLISFSSFLSLSSIFSPAPSLPFSSILNLSYSILITIV